MRYYRLETKEKSITLYPFVCWHVGAPQSDYEFIDQMVRRLEDDPFGRGIYMGDGGECVTKNSKGLIYEQTMAPQEQLNYLKHKLDPVREKMLFGIKGNHGWRTFKDSGLGFDESLCLALGIPYFGTSVFWNLLVNRSSYDIYTHHGVDSGVAIGTKINKAKKFEEVVVADAIMSAHSHICAVVPPHHRAFLIDNKTGEKESRIRWRTTHGYICGCAYDSRTGYAEDKAYPPILPAHIAITFGGRTHNGKIVKEQTYQMFHSDANRERQPNEEDSITRMQAGGLSCTKHPGYEGRGRPTSSCETCWRIYITHHP